MLQQTRVRANIRLLHWFRVSLMMIFFTPVFMLYLEEQFGRADAILLQTLYVVTLTLFEIPAGMFADRYGKQKALVLGSLILGISVIAYGIVHSFAAFAAVEIALGVGTSLVSGTVQALLSATLTEAGRAAEYEKIYGKMAHHSFVAMAAANITGGIIASLFGFEATFWATAVTTLTAALIATRITEVKQTKVHSSHKAHFIAAARSLLVENRALRYVVILSLSIYLMNQMLFNMYQPYLVQSGVGVVWIGVIFASFHVVTGLGARYAAAFKRRFGFHGTLWILVALVIASIFLLGNIIAWYSFLFIYLQQVVRGIRPVIVSDFIQKNVSQSHLTTALSIESFLASVAYAPFMSLLAFLTGHFTLAQTINIIGLIAITIAALILVGTKVAGKRRGRIEELV